MLNEGIDWLIEPNQSQTKIMVNGMEGHEFEIDMYEKVSMKIEFYDKAGGKLFLGDLINFTLEEDPNKPYSFIFQPETFTYDYIFDYGVIGQEIDLNFYYYFNTNNSIASDTHLSLIHI